MNELEGGPPLMRSGVSKRIWDLLDEDPDAFKKRLLRILQLAILALPLYGQSIQIFI